ncbi:hydrogenase maturation nickel metallochaperone HypA [Streptomyces griseocarneus]|uniref:hydrogenase maturation nickel metallochaperone HypA n=1 Tax=Streptomyces griseocarneus TaxID=51201 RepID=UPI00167E6523|nr:hydrogenase maturation nickel metallochaperone HypA [Streptomyces griseocarneus]MBZ6475727.1 hydrogenase maturation nickel metallochaperone HypA [Streptomyces griseocarneus]GHG51123.1 putative hydrogenase nickel incorporation protein HypA [Streptomyces griseocarneus]
MHELSIATAIVERATELARRHDAGGVEAVRVRVGEMSGVVPDALRFSFEVAREGTVVEAARLDVEEVPARAHCAACEKEFAVGTPPFLWCPRCDSPTTRLLSGRELEITVIELAEATA